MQVNWKRFWRKTHYWASFVVAIPLLVVIVSGLFLQLKKDVAWIQPPTARGSTSELAISFDEILAAAMTADEAEITSWDDVDRLDVRPDKGIVKVRGKNRWEVQIDTATADVVQVMYRRSDLIESIHDGSWFHDLAKLWIFLPAAVVLLGLWLTGMYLFILPFQAKATKRRKQQATADTSS